MKKTILIILGVLTITLVISVWVYLLMFGKPANSAEVFSRFGIGGGEEAVIDTPISTTPTEFDSVINTTPSKLRQLTTRPVAGAHIKGSVVRYVEQGTGHVYEINLESGAETLVSGTTMPQTTSALFSQDGVYIAITSFTTGGTETIVGTIDNGQVSGVALPSGAYEIAFADEGSIYYLLEQVSGASGYLYNIEKETSTEIFAIPLRDVRILWGDPHYVYTTPTARQIGYVYEINGKGTLSFITPGAYGLIGVRYGDGVVVTGTTNATHSTKAHSNGTQPISQALPLIPEKCIKNPSDELYLFCGVPTTIDTKSFPDAWYMGSVSYNDNLWSMDTTTGEATPMLSFLSESGREMDVYKIEVDEIGMRLLFVNKNDNSLWMFDRGVE